MVFEGLTLLFKHKDTNYSINKFCFFKTQENQGFSIQKL